MIDLNCFRCRTGGLKRLKRRAIFGTDERTANVRDFGSVTIIWGEDDRGDAVRLVYYSDAETGTFRCGWAYDRRTVEQWADEWPTGD